MASNVVPFTMLVAFAERVLRLAQGITMTRFDVFKSPHGCGGGGIKLLLDYVGRGLQERMSTGAGSGIRTAGYRSRSALR